MKYIKIFSFIVLFTLVYSCKDKQSSQDKILDEKTEKQTSKKEHSIPSGLKIESQEEIDIDNDGVKEVIITATDSEATNSYEFWYKNDQLIYQFTYPCGSINKKWLVNLDNDNEKRLFVFKDMKMV